MIKTLLHQDFQLSKQILDHARVIPSKLPLLKTPYQVEQAAVAVLSAVGAIADSTGTQVEERVAAAMMRQDRYMLMNNEKLKLWDEISGLYRGDASGRWIQFHCNFLHHKNRVLQVLGLPLDAKRGDVEKAVAACTDLFALEEELFQAGACASVVRSPEEWKATKQYEAVKDLPLFEMVEIPGTGSQRRRGIKSVKDAKCLDFSRVIAGPICGRTLADLGANVMRVSSPELPFIEACCLATGHNKRACFLDLNKDSATLDKLLQETDVVINAYRPGCLQKFGLDSETLASRFPGIVVVELSAYSHVGPWKTKRGFDSLMQSTTGMVHQHSKSLGRDFSKESPPVHLPVQALDYITGYVGAFAAMKALESAASCVIKLSLCQTANWLQKQGLKEGDVWKKAEDIPVEAIQDLLVETKLMDGNVLTSLDVPLKGMMTLRSPPVPLGFHQPSWRES